MRPIHLLTLSLACFAITISGCESENQGKLEGTYWSSLEMEYKGYTIPPGAMRLEFRKDGTLTYQTVEGKYDGRFAYSWGDRVVFNLDKEVAGRKEHVEKIKIKDKRLTMTDSDGTSATFRLVGNW